MLVVILEYLYHSTAAKASKKKGPGGPDLLERMFAKAVKIDYRSLSAALW
jgi:hypothetical protein